MDRSKYQLTIEEDGKLHTEEYDAIIGLELRGNSLLLHIRERGNWPDSFWIQLPDLMKQYIDRGLAERKKSLMKKQD